MMTSPTILAEMKEHFVRKFKVELHLPKDDQTMKYISPILEEDKDKYGNLLQTIVYYNIVDDTVSIRETEIIRIARP